MLRDVIAPLSKFADWLFIQALFVRMPSIEERLLQFEDAIRFLPLRPPRGLRAKPRRKES